MFLCLPGSIFLVILRQRKKIFFNLLVSHHLKVSPAFHIHEHLFFSHHLSLASILLSMLCLSQSKSYNGFSVNLTLTMIWYFFVTGANQVHLGFVEPRSSVLVNWPPQAPTGNPTRSSQIAPVFPTSSAGCRRPGPSQNQVAVLPATCLWTL